MINHKKTFILKLPQLIFGLIIYVGCSDVVNTQSDNILQEEGNIHLLIKCPYSCFNDIKIDKKGAGLSIVGFPKGNHADTIIEKKSFIINSENDMLALKRSVDSISTKPLKAPIPMDDGYRFTLTIDNKLVLDRYGQDSLINNILTILFPYVERVENGQCDFFNLYRRSL